MIEITHSQARRLIRQGIDRRLPEAQWAVLQAHLEGCPECSRYRDRMVTSERSLTHALRLRWAGARVPAMGITKFLVGRRQRRLHFRKFLGKAAWYALALLVLLIYIGYRRVTAPPRPAAPVPPTATAALKPTAPAPTLFHGLAAFSASVDGNADVYLLNASGGQPEITNLTQYPASETHPSWSPDGEWIAFLSDRSGKNEVYLLTVAGSRLTQITSSADVDWQGPLEWSYDGRWIALTGVRAGMKDAFLYLVPTDGGTPASIAYTRGAQPWARFSSSLPYLAIPSPDTAPFSDQGLSVINLETGWVGWLTQEDNNAFNLRAAKQGAFDWSLGGRSLVYVADGPFNPRNGQPEEGASSMLRLSPELDARSTTDFNGAGAQIIDMQPGVGSFRAVSWVPNSLLVAALRKDPDGCWTVRINHYYNRLVPSRDLSGLCVEGGLERANWTSDGSWLVLLARTPAETRPAIYALRVGMDDEGQVKAEGASAPVYFERLAEIPGGTVPPALELRVRPAARSLGLMPRSRALAATPAPSQEPRLPLNAPWLPEWIYYTAAADQTSRLFRVHPDGSDPLALTGVDMRAACPRAAPGGGGVAYLAQAAENPPGPPNLYLIPAGDTRPVKLTSNQFLSQGSPDIPAQVSCPAWSPNEQYLAFFISGPGSYYLAVVAVDGKTPAKYVLIDGFGLSEPVWLPQDPETGAANILVAVPQARQTARLVEVDWLKSEDMGAAVSEVRSLLTSWDDVWGLALSPDGKRLAGVFIYYNQGLRQVGPAIAQLRVLDARNYNVLDAYSLANFDLYSFGQGSLAWLEDGRLGLARATARVGSRKSVFERYALAEPTAPDRVQEIANFEDIVTSAAWDPTGWVVFAAESGLWALDARSLTRGVPPPSLLRPELAYDLSWR